ncbi:MAG: glycerol transporter [Bogoriella megaspora]|nr:MAG: glycerol transporter [Bogoriella megaspora]
MSSWLSWLKRLYSLETLDLRFVPNKPSTDQRIDPVKPSPEEFKNRPNGGKGLSPANGAQPSKWDTPEFYVYYIVFAICIPLMFYIPNSVSQESNPQWSQIKPLLSSGWIPGRQVDNSDAQYGSFRDNIPYMAILLVIHPLLRRLYDSFWMSSNYTKVRAIPGDDRGLTQGLSASAAADARMQQRISFDLGFAFIFIIALYGFSAIKILLILYVNFQIAKSLPRQVVPLLTWVFAIGILFANEFGHGYPFEKIAAVLSPTFSSRDKAPGASPNWGRWLDSYGGLIPRWEVLFKVTVLRMISFNMDYYWSLDYRQSSALEKKQPTPTSLTERDRISTPAPPSSFTFRTYLAYALYSPLYIAGPILTFNDHISQLRHPLPTSTPLRTLLYAIRFLLTLLCMELLLHFIYAVAISKSSPDWHTHYSPVQLAMLGFFNLHIIWLKLLIPWRFFRLWALIDGIDPPENMVRCMSDNYSALAFWRGWHRSLNRWIVRYVFIPLGGSRAEKGEGGVWVKVRAVGNFLAVFTFVALWHDIQLRLLMWGWLIVLFVLPEVLAKMAFPKRMFKGREDTYRWLCGLGAVGNILMMMAANLVGFAVGLDGLKGLVQGIVGSASGVVFLGIACAALFVGAQVMFEIREQELREGIRMKC